MCNKSFFRVAAVSLCLTAFFVVDADAAKTNKAQGAHPWKTEENKSVASNFSNWSLLFNAGFNAFDGDFNSGKGKEMAHPVYAPSVGLGLEYSFTPLLGLGVDYTFDMYRVTGQEGHPAILLDGMMHKAGAYLTVDLMSGFAPRAARKLAALQLFAGGGAGFYKNSVYYSAKTLSGTTEADAKKMDSYDAAPYVNIGLGVEFNVSRSIALGLKAQYAYFTKDVIDGRANAVDEKGVIGSVNNDGIIDVALSLRYKIDAVHKTHMRNIPSQEVITNAAMESRLDDLQKQLNAVQKQRPTAVEGRDTVIIYYRDTVIYREASEVVRAIEQPKEEQYYFVYFDNGKSKLSDEGEIAVQQVAARMERETQRYAVILGYCDNTGSQNINNVLGEARAESVAQELINEYGIAPDKVAACGRGVIVSKTGKNVAAANRRAEIRLVDKAEFERFKNECESKSAAQEPGVLNVSADTNTDTMPAWAMAEETLTADMTLAKLARKYYQNTHCWVYIYQANKKVIANPNKLVSGLKLYIPSLSEAQRTITKDQCLELYRNTRTK